MKILFHHRIASLDGQAVHMNELVEALRAQGHEVVIIGPRSTAQLQFGGSARAIDILKQRLPRAAYEVLELGYNLVVLARLHRALARHRPDAVYERYNLFTVAGSWLCRWRGLPYLVEINAPLALERTQNGELSLRALGRWSERLVWRSADYALPVTEVLAEHVARAGVPRKRIVVVPNGVNWQRFADLPTREEAKRRLGLSGRLVLGFAGFVRAWHGLDHLIDFLAARGGLYNAHLLLIGDGPARAELEARAARGGVADRLTVTGVLDRGQVARHLAAFDIALQPGVTAYASPLKLFEYMAAGCAILAPNNANIQEVLTQRENAVLFEPDEAGALTRALEDLCRDGALRERLGQAARQTLFARDLFWASNAARVAALCAQAAEDRRHGPGIKAGASAREGVPGR